jgi:predicted DNA-binding transcriptional regulator AlpA
MATATKNAGRDIDALLDELPGLVTREELLTLFRVSRMTLFNWMRDEGFPRPLRLASRSNRWVKAAVRRWVEERVR